MAVAAARRLAADLTVDDTVLRGFCRAHGIRSLRLFGSAARNELRATATSTCSSSSNQAGKPVCSASPCSNSSYRSCSAGRSTSVPPVT
jgi:hypothetical protein